MASPTAAIVRRALLYVPGSSQKMLDKSRLLAVDCVTYDLEDSVTSSRKVEARATLRRFLSQPRATSIKEQAVRINAVDSGLALSDLTEILQTPAAASNIDAIVVPKVTSASDLHFVTDVIRHTLPDRHPSSSSSSATQPSTALPPIKLLALIESARGLSDLSSICKASPYLSGLIFAAEDFATDLSLTRTPSLQEFLYARSAIVTAARAHDLPSAIDLVCTAYKGADAQRALEEECLGGRGLGFNGKQCIHPSQVELAQRAFAPAQKELEWAVRLLVADAKATERGRGAWTLDGKMVDKPVAGLARNIVAKAQACGLDVDSLRERWRDQEPE